MDMLEKYTDWFKQASRPMQAVIVVALLLVVYLAIDTEVRLLAGLNEKSAELSAKLDLYSAGGFSEQAHKVEEKHRRFGDVRILTTQEVGPTGGGAGSLLSGILTGILKSEGASIRNSNQKPAAPLTTGQHKAVQRVPYEFTFETSPGALPAILERIESEPRIARIVSLDVRRDSRSTMLTVTLEAEIWWKS